jgi:hypothetical protein
VSTILKFKRIIWGFPRIRRYVFGVELMTKIPYIDFSFPGIEIKVESNVLKEYIFQVESGVNSICKKYMDTELDKYKGEHYLEYVHVYAIAEDELPRVILNPITLSIYALFESSINRLLIYCQNKENQVRSLKDIKGKSLLSRVNKYIEQVLLYDYKFSDSDIQTLTSLIAVRNCIAHANGDLNQLDQRKKNNLSKIINNRNDLSVFSEQICVSAQYLQNMFGLIDQLLRNFMLFIENKHINNHT